MNKILVTGSSGFIGSALVNKLQNSGYEVTKISSKNGDITLAKTFSSYDLSGYKHVYHLAARTYVPDSWKSPSEFNRTNVLGTSNVLDLCQKFNVRMTYVSAYVYGIPDRLPVKESDPVNPNNPYALSKFLAEKLCEFYANYYDLDITVIRPFNVYGPGQRSHFLIPAVITQLEHDRIEVQDTKAKRDYIYIDDVVLALCKSMKAPSGFNIYNIGSGHSLSVSDVINNILESAGKNLPVHCNEKTRRNELPDVYASIEKAKNELDWTPTIPFQDGIKRILNVIKYE